MGDLPSRIGIDDQDEVCLFLNNPRFEIFNSKEHVRRLIKGLKG